MGQYYKPMILSEKKDGKAGTKPQAWVYSHDITYTFKRADGSTCELGNGLKLMEHSWMKNDFVSAFESLIKSNPKFVVWSGDYADAETGCKSNLYDRCTNANKVLPTERPNMKETRFVVNHTKKLYVDKYKVPKSSDGWRIHPLPILTCEGNGRGGGDLYLEHELIGAWSRDKISVEPTKPKGYKEVIFDLIEE